MVGEQDAVSAGEFGRWRSDFQAFQARLDERLDAGFGGMNDRLDDLNGRTRKNSEAISVLDERVNSIRVSGCAQLSAHRAVMDEVPLAVRKTWRDWHPAAKAGAGVGVGAGLIAVVELINRLLAHFGM
jgi:hypothetical protein